MNEYIVYYISGIFRGGWILLYISGVFGEEDQRTHTCTIQSPEDHSAAASNMETPNWHPLIMSIRRNKRCPHLCGDERGCETSTGGRGSDWLQNRLSRRVNAAAQVKPAVLRHPQLASLWRLFFMGPERWLLSFCDFFLLLLLLPLLISKLLLIMLKALF